MLILKGCHQPKILLEKGSGLNTLFGSNTEKGKMSEPSKKDLLKHFKLIKCLYMPKGAKTIRETEMPCIYCQTICHLIEKVVESGRFHKRGIDKMTKTS